MRLQDTVIVVTGASAGLGKEMARGFAREGASVVCAARTEQRLVDLVDEIRDGGGQAHGITVDVRSWESVQSLFEEVREAYGPTDVLVNNAGIAQYSFRSDYTPKPVAELPIDVWDAILETNLRGAFLTSRAVLPAMLERETGRLIHVSSGHGISGRAYRAAYAASKFGLEGFAESLAQELEESGVSSMLFRPPMGGVFTERRARIEGRDPHSFDHQSASVVVEPAVQLASGEGNNGGRYIGLGDGTGFKDYSRAESLEFSSESEQ